MKLLLSENAIGRLRSFSSIVIIIGFFSSTFQSDKRTINLDAANRRLISADLDLYNVETHAKNDSYGEDLGVI